jgi:hypothetical protein
MHGSCIDVIVLGFKSVEELYPSPPLGVDNADTSQLPKEKNSVLWNRNYLLRFRFRF